VQPKAGEGSGGERVSNHTRCRRFLFEPMKFDFTFELVRKGVYILTAEGFVEIEQDGHYPGHWRFGRIVFEDLGETYTLNASNAFDAALRAEIIGWLKAKRSEQIEDEWIRQLPPRQQRRVIDDLTPERAY
jgi:hypothetical protein